MSEAIQDTSPWTPDVHDLPGDRLRLLWILSRAEEISGSPLMTPAEISNVLRDAHQINVPWQRVEAILAREDDAVARRKKGGRRAYQLMRSGLSEIQSLSSGVVVINPEQALSSIRRFQVVLQSLKGDIRICDPYTDPRTIDMLAECRSAESVKLLTVNIYKERSVRRDMAAFLVEHEAPLSIRVAETPTLHDRYIIHDEGMLLVGASLNGIGKKQCFVVEVGWDIRDATLSVFNAAWAKATSF